MIPLYHETRALRETVERLLADVPAGTHGVPS